MLSGGGTGSPVAVRRLDAARRTDFFRLHGHPPFDWCFCVAWNVESWAGWGERSAAENRALREEMLARGRFDGYLLYVGDQVGGWCQCGPRDGWPKLRLEFDLAPCPDTWAVTCFCIRPEYRRRGLAHALLAEVLADLRRRGVVRVEAFPRPGRHEDGEVWTGPESLFVRAGFRPLKANGRRSVMSLELAPRQVGADRGDHGS